MEYIIKEFVDKLKEEDIKSFALKERVTNTDEEVKTIYMYIKNYWQVFYKDNPDALFKELKEKLSDGIYNKIIELYNKYKKK